MCAYFNTNKMNALNGHIPHVNIYQPNNDWQYTVLVSELPYDGFMGGGDPDAYVVVTVWLPTEHVGRSYVMAKEGTLTTGYVAEKFGEGLDTTNAEDLAMLKMVADAIRETLGRPSLDEEGWQ